MQRMLRRTYESTSLNFVLVSNEWKSVDGKRRCLMKEKKKTDLQGKMLRRISSCGHLLKRMTTLQAWMNDLVESFGINE